MNIMQRIFVRVSLRLLASIVLILVVLQLGAGRVAAQDPPAGSYQDSCRNILVEIVRQGTGIQTVFGLSAECETISGDWHWTRLDDFGYCESNISNSDGWLTCQKRNAPRGSYEATCVEI